jgi:SapC
MQNGSAVAVERMWGRHPIALERDALRRRIYAPVAYAAVRNSAVVPVVHTEAYQLAAWFPLVWRQRGAEYDLVVVRALLDDQRAQPRAARALLPRILQAYPFMLEPTNPAGMEGERMLEDVFADQPTDVGASITTVAGKFSRATILRLGILDGLANDLAVTRRIGELLASRGLLEPWQLKFEIAGRSVEVADLFIVRQDTFETGKLSPVMEELGGPAALVLGLHRISVFRAGALLATARTLLESSPSGTADDQAHTAA